MSEGVTKAPGQSREESGIRPLVSKAIWVFLGVFLVAVAGIKLTQQTGRIASIWLANAVVLLALLGSGRRRWPLWLFIGWLGNWTANQVVGDAGWMAFALSLCNSLEILLAGTLLEGRVPWSSGKLRTMPGLLRFLAAAGVAGPMASALVAATILGHASAVPFGQAFTGWYTADALGLLSIVPLVHGANREE